MTRRRKEIQNQLVIVNNDALQVPPYTAVTVEAGLQDGPVHTVTAFSKAHPNDEFCPVMGARIASGRALAQIARTIEKDERRAEFIGLPDRLQEQIETRAREEAFLPI